MRKIKKIYLGLALIILSNKSTAQPYLDIINLKYSNSPNASFTDKNKNDLKIDYYSIGTNLPLQFNNKKDALIFSPFFEAWSTEIKSIARHNYYGAGLPITLSKKIPHSKWNILITGILRMNDSSINVKGKMQVGAALISAYKKDKNLTWKLGIYINNDLFGIFVMPLLGIDWNITKRDNLFGVLPGNLTYEHQLSKHFYYGANFRAITNSYAKKTGYWRIDENQLGIYLDTYFNKNLVLNIEAGHSLLRKIRTGVKDVSTYDAEVNDNLYLKLSFAYRVRFAK